MFAIAGAYKHICLYINALRYKKNVHTNAMEQVKCKFLHSSQHTFAHMDMLWCVYEFEHVVRVQIIAVAYILAQLEINGRQRE